MSHAVRGADFGSAGAGVAVPESGGLAVRVPVAGEGQSSHHHPSPLSAFLRLAKEPTSMEVLRAEKAKNT